jgi:hypothetical protein
VSRRPGAGEGGLVNFRQVESEVRGYVGVVLVDAAVEDGDANAFAHGDVPWSMGGAAGNSVTVSADLLDGPPLRRRGVVGVKGSGRHFAGGNDRTKGIAGAEGQRTWSGRKRDGLGDEKALFTGGRGGWKLDLETVYADVAVVDHGLDVGESAEPGEGGGVG